MGSRIQSESGSRTPRLIWAILREALTARNRGVARREREQFRESGSIWSKMRTALVRLIFIQGKVLAASGSFSLGATPGDGRLTRGREDEVRFGLRRRRC